MRPSCTAIEPLLKEFGFVNAESICRAKGQSTHTWLLHFSGGQNVEEMVKAFRATGLFDIVEPNGYLQGCVIPNDPRFPDQYGLHNTGNFNLTFSINDADADLPEAWDIEQGDTNVVVAVIDAGIAFAHPEFAGRTWVNYGEVPNNNTDDDNNGFIDDDRGWNFAYGTNSPDDDYGHGTASAGVIGANGDNGFGSAGIDWNCKLMICKVLDSNNFATFANVANALYYSADNGAHIINMSLSGSYSATQEAAIQYAWNSGCAMFAATGNSNSSIPGYPAADTNVMAVGGSNAWDVRYIWSNYGSHMDVVAAGDYVYIVDWDDFNSDSTWASGTSLASPFVAGIGALLKGQNLALTNQEIYDIIRLTAEDEVDNFTNEDTPGWDIYFGYGRVNAYQAILYDTSSTGTKTVSMETVLRVFPNPTKGGFLLSWLTKKPSEADLFLRSIEGAVILHKIIYARVGVNRIFLDLSGQAAGIYLLTFSTADRVFAKKIVLTN